MENQDQKEKKLLDELETMYQRVAESEKSEAGGIHKDALQSYYESLQISPDAPLEKIKESYERLVDLWEPSQFADSPPLREEAERKLAEITHAYEKILASRQREIPRPVESPKGIPGAPDRSAPEEETGYRFPRGLIPLGGSAIAVVLLAAFFWPTFYHYATIPSGDRIYQIRTNRITGSMAYFDGVKWSNLPFPVGQPSAPAAIPDLASSANPPAPSQGQPTAAPPTKLGPADERGVTGGKEASSEARPRQPAEAKGFAIQVSAMRDLNRAKEFVESQKKSGQALYLAKITAKDGGVWYRIFLGHFANRAEAARYMKENKIKESFPESFIQKLSG